MRPSENNRVGRLLGIAAISALACSCRPTPWVTVAERASLSELKYAVAQRQRRGTIDRQAVVELAQAIVRREVHSATDPNGEALLSQLSDCALSVNAQLHKRAQRNDHTAGAALFTLVEAGQDLSVTEWLAASRSEVGSRRAAAALASDAPERWTVRELLLRDADQRVRRAALKSCMNAPAQIHFDTLVGVLRRDPDPICRQLAARGIGVLGGSDADTALSDAFSQADTQLRLAIISGWARARTFTVGGRQRLVEVARGEPGIVGVLAAADLARGLSDARPLGQARITRSLEFGSTEDRPLAIAAADWSRADQGQLLIRLGLNADPETRILALGRWLELPAHRWLARTWLRTLAEVDDSTAIGARTILASDGDRSVIASLRTQLTYANWQSRAQAARDLWRLEDMAGFGRALADDAPEVRIAAACIAIAPSLDRSR